MIRRTLVAVAGLALAAGTAAPGVAAAPSDWAGSRIVTAGTSASSAPAIEAFIVHDHPEQLYRLDVTTELIAPVERPAGCTTSVGATSVGPPDANGGRATSAPASVNCNGSYGIKVTARLLQREVFGGEERVVDTHTMTAENALAMVAPPPDVSVTAEPGADRSVVVGWEPVSEPPPDLLGFRVERQRANGAPVTIATINDPAARSFTDSELPEEGGSTTYRVVARRSGPQGIVVSESAGQATADVAPVAPPTSGDPADPAAGGPGGGSPAPGAGTPGGAPGSSNTGGGTPFRVPSVGRSSGNVVPPLSSPPTTLDTGYDQFLPFGEREPGAEEPVLPDDELASLIYEDEAGRGLIVPIATGLLLAVWALHLRFLARAARPAAEQ